jgi:hypothetical protein
MLVRRLSAMFAVIPILCVSIYLVKYRRLYAAQADSTRIGRGVAGRRALFEIDMRFISGWQERAAEVAYYTPIEEPSTFSQRSTSRS